MVQSILPYGEKWIIHIRPPDRGGDQKWSRPKQEKNVVLRDFGFPYCKCIISCTYIEFPDDLWSITRSSTSFLFCNFCYQDGSTPNVRGLFGRMFLRLSSLCPIRNTVHDPFFSYTNTLFFVPPKVAISYQPLPRDFSATKVIPNLSPFLSSTWV